jgi:hypothetical protein
MGGVGWRHAHRRRNRPERHQTEALAADRAAGYPAGRACRLAGRTLLLLQVQPGQALGWHIPLFLGWVGVFFVAVIASTLAVSGAARSGPMSTSGFTDGRCRPRLVRRLQ